MLSTEFHGPSLTYPVLSRVVLCSARWSGGASWNWCSAKHTYYNASKKRFDFNAQPTFLLRLLKCCHETVVVARYMPREITSPLRMPFLVCVLGDICMRCLDLLGCLAQHLETPLGTEQPIRTPHYHTMQLVAVKAYEWQDHASQVTNQV